MNGVDVDSGTAFELGYGFAKGKKLFGLHTDFRVFSPTSEVNLMMLKSCVICHSLQELDIAYAFDEDGIGTSDFGILDNVHKFSLGLDF